jgi:hypothetical protein
VSNEPFLQKTTLCLFFPQPVDQFIISSSPISLLSLVRSTWSPSFPILASLSGTIPIQSCRPAPPLHSLAGRPNPPPSPAVLLVAGPSYLRAHQFIHRRISGGSASCNLPRAMRREVERLWLGLASAAPDLDAPSSILHQDDSRRSAADQIDSKQMIHYFFLILQGLNCKTHL